MTQNLGKSANPNRFREAFKVVLVTPKCIAVSVFVILGSDNIATALRISELDKAGFRPPFRPLALAACSPTIVRS